MWLKPVGQGLVSVRRKGCKEGNPESMLQSLEDPWLGARLFICRAKPPEVYLTANATELNTAERPNDEGRSALGTLGLGSARVERPREHLVNTVGVQLGDYKDLTYRKDHTLGEELF